MLVCFGDYCRAEEQFIGVDISNIPLETEYFLVFLCWGELRCKRIIFGAWISGIKWKQSFRKNRHGEGEYKWLDFHEFTSKECSVMEHGLAEFKRRYRLLGLGLGREIWMIVAGRQEVAVVPELSD